jgi:hypothetical protein
LPSALFVLLVGTRTKAGEPETVLLLCGHPRNNDAFAVGANFACQSYRRSRVLTDAGEVLGRDLEHLPIGHKCVLGTSLCTGKRTVVRVHGFTS